MSLLSGAEQPILSMMMIIILTSALDPRHSVTRIFFWPRFSRAHRIGTDLSSRNAPKRFSVSFRARWASSSSRVVRAAFSGTLSCACRLCVCPCACACL
uniref:Putative secreted protein n=1 Tax=Anopheles triannulatus TaxID=58253 RepID=A0A2M4B472_9DIPT